MQIRDYMAEEGGTGTTQGEDENCVVVEETKTHGKGMSDHGETLGLLTDHTDDGSSYGSKDGSSTNSAGGHVVFV